MDVEFSQVRRDVSKVEVEVKTEIDITMMLILDGNSEIGAHVRSNLCFFLSV